MDKTINKNGNYKRLILNTVLFAIGQFGPSLLGFFLVPIYTNCMSQSEFGTADLVINLSNLLIPFVSICITDGVVKFSLDGKHDKKSVFSVSFFICLLGSILSFIAYPFIYKYGQISGYVLLFYMVLITSVFNNLLLLYIKSIKRLKLYTIIALVKSAIMLISNIIALRVLNLKTEGFLWSFIISNIAGCLMAVLTARLHHFISIRNLQKKTTKEMVAFSLPLIPNQASISVMTSMDRYMLTYLLDSSYNGLYSVAHKIPDFVGRLSMVFNQAWNYSVLENQTQNIKNNYYQSIYTLYSSYMFIIASIVMMLIRPIMYVWVGSEFRDAWLYAPYLLISIIFSCFTGFYVPLFVICEKTGTLFISTLAGAITNLTLNYLLIPVWGINGASFASAVGYLVVWLMRGIMIKKYVKIEFDNIKAIINAIILILQGTCLIKLALSYFWVQIVILSIVILINIKDIKNLVIFLKNSLLRKSH